MPVEAGGASAPSAALTWTFQQEVPSVARQGQGGLTVALRGLAALAPATAVLAGLPVALRVAGAIAAVAASMSERLASGGAAAATRSACPPARLPACLWGLLNALAALSLPRIRTSAAAPVGSVVQDCNHAGERPPPLHLPIQTRSPLPGVVRLLSIHCDLPRDDFLRAAAWTRELWRWQASRLPCRRCRRRRPPCWTRCLCWSTSCWVRG
jgi:hypothetical protein